MDCGVEISGLRKSYGTRRVLDDVSVTVGRGEVVGLLGPNGAGKTTLVSILAGLLGADAGSVRALGIDVLRSAHAIRGRLGLAGQDIAVYPSHTVEENLRFFGAIGGLRRKALRQSVVDLVEALDLVEQRTQRARELSGGQLRRLHAGCALVHRPELVLLDEPTAGADPQTRLRLLDLVRKLAADGVTVVYTTHYLTEIEDLDARVVVLGRGRVLAQGSVEELVDTHTRSEIVLRFHGPAPEVCWPGATTSADALHLPTARPALDVVAALDAVGEGRGRLRAVELARADLERAYLAILAAEDLTCTA